MDPSQILCGAAPPADSCRDQGDIVVGWLGKVAVGIFISGIVVFDGLSVFSTRLALQDDAGQAARAASDSWQATKSGAQALLAAEEAAKAESPDNVLTPDSLQIASDGTVTLTVRRTAKSLVLRHISPLRKWTLATAAGNARSVF
jgi:Flp pilus assembly protein TadG